MTCCCSTGISCLQDLNPIPFPIVIANCVAWVAYAVVNKDPYVFLANDPGILLGLFYTLSAYGYADVKVLVSASQTRCRMSYACALRIAASTNVNHCLIQPYGYAFVCHRTYASALSKLMLACAYHLRHCQGFACPHASSHINACDSKAAYECMQDMPTSKVFNLWTPVSCTCHVDACDRSMLYLMPVTTRMWASCRACPPAHSSYSCLWVFAEHVHKQTLEIDACVMRMSYRCQCHGISMLYMMPVTTLHVVPCRTCP